MALILQIETSTSTCAVALASEGETIASRELNERNAHASNLTLMIEEVLRTAAKGMKDLDAVAVSKGPGSYTGLRIGVSTAKGLCYALDIPLIAIGTLEAMALNFQEHYPGDAPLYCPMIDARRMEVYSAIYDRELNEILPVDARIIDGNSFSDILGSKSVVFFGDGAMKCKDVLSHHVKAQFVPDYLNSARAMSKLALDKFTAKQFENVAYFEPYYLKDFLVTQPRAIE